MTLRHFRLALGKNNLDVTKLNNGKMYRLEETSISDGEIGMDPNYFIESIISEKYGYNDPASLTFSYF